MKWGDGGSPKQANMIMATIYTYYIYMYIIYHGVYMYIYLHYRMTIHCVYIDVC